LGFVHLLETNFIVLVHLIQDSPIEIAERGLAGELVLCWIAAGAVVDREHLSIVSLLGEIVNFVLIFLFCSSCRVKNLLVMLMSHDFINALTDSPQSIVVGKILSIIKEVASVELLHSFFRVLETLFLRMEKGHQLYRLVLLLEFPY
jgi:hypothetical protein